MEKQCMNDYEMISISNKKKKRKLKVEDTVQIYEESVRWLTTEIEKHKDRKVVVVTHHAPLLKGVSSPYYEQANLDLETKLCNHAFSSDLSHLCMSPVTLWIFGHTHYSSNQTHNEVSITSNQLGYIAFNDMDSDNTYREDLVIDLKNY